MVYYDNDGSRVRSPRIRRRPSEATEVGEADAAYIREVAEALPNFTPVEVWAEIHHSRRHGGISVEMVRKVLGR
ncbi:hypothetical protein [Streptomyces iconiensis]|uniref:Uncharacterized protein n=1 Tax=Streptomyces iconiensis TaxID=1384038 RepID=A0ABT6ZQ89_9ACTN|nr:hypothetical protein [Streptomyces iconiensis]MDJ1131222.1 hypothetical protein [Streptomyces iconiensis]